MGGRKEQLASFSTIKKLEKNTIVNGRSFINPEFLMFLSFYL
jgi:hypothetical protein